MNQRTAADVMTRNVKTAHPEWSLELLLTFFSDNSITGAPVVGDDGTLLGVVSLTDVARSGATVERSDKRRETPGFYRDGVEVYVSRDEIDRMVQETNAEVRVHDLMTPMVFSVGEDATVQEVAGAMLTGRIHRVFVMKQQQIVGIVSSMDLLQVVRDL